MRLNNPKPRTSFQLLNGRLALFSEGSVQSEYWQEYWATGYGSESQRGRDGLIPEIGELIDRWARRDRIVLEAGCGPGHHVAALSARGFNAIGIEIEPEVVERARSIRPDLDLRVGNVLDLDLDDHSVGCYLSLGVVEHFIDGPSEALREAHRILAPDGVALISVPYLNPGRQRERAASRPTSASASRFHQYYFDEHEFSKLAGEAGFEIKESFAYGLEAYLGREHPVFSRFWNSSLARERIRRLVRRSLRTAPRFVRNQYGHMILFVCVPRGSD